MTMAEVKKMNEGCFNGFELDLNHLLFHKEKEFVKSIELPNGTFLHVRVEWDEYKEVKQNAYGQSFSVYTGMYIPKLHFSIWQKDGNFLKSSGLGRWLDIPGETPVKRRSCKKLQELTKNYNTERCLKLFEEAKRTQKNLLA